jgi:RNA polymerase sigma-70 factor (ECF subfamily)
MPDGGKSFEILVAEYREMVCTYLLGIVGDPHMAEDLTQETFLVAGRRLESFRPGESFGAWLRGIARNKTRESRRASARHAVVADSDLIAGMEDVYARMDDKALGDSWADRLGLVRGCLDALPQEMREAIEMIYAAEIAVPAAAARAKVNPGTFQRRLGRARDKVRECIESKLRLETVR